MKRLIMFCLLCFSLMVLSITKVSAKPIDMSYLQAADVAMLSPIDTKAGLYKLTLNHVGPYVTYFSDRPNRIVGKLYNQKFIDEWRQGNNNFGTDAPNAVLNGIMKVDNKDQPVNIVMALSNPVFDSALGQISYDVHILPANNNMPSYKLMKLYYSTLFIDGNPCISCM